MESRLLAREVWRSLWLISATLLCMGGDRECINFILKTGKLAGWSVFQGIWFRSASACP